MGNWCYIEMCRVSDLLSGNGSLLGGAPNDPCLLYSPPCVVTAPWTWAGPEIHLTSRSWHKWPCPSPDLSLSRPGCFYVCTLESPQSPSKTGSSWLTEETLSVLRPCRETHGEGERGVQLADPPSPVLPRPQPATWMHPQEGQPVGSPEEQPSWAQPRLWNCEQIQCLLVSAMEFWMVSYSAKENQSHVWVGFEPRSVGLKRVFISLW